MLGAERMKRLILFRHAKSDWSRLGGATSYLKDIERPLSKRGRNACEKISEFFSSIQLHVDLVEYSPAKRATETFSLTKESFSFLTCKENSKLYTFDSRNLMQEISTKSNKLSDFLLIGHNPAIEDLIGTLVPPEQNSRNLIILKEKYPTGAIAFLKLNVSSWNEIKENCAVLTDFVRPIDIVAERAQN